MHPFIHHYQGSLLGPVLFDIFPNDLDAEAEHIPSKFGSDAKLGGAADPWRPRRAVWVRQGTGRAAVAQSSAKGMPGGVWRGQEWASVASVLPSTQRMGRSWKASRGGPEAGKGLGGRSWEERLRPPGLSSGEEEAERKTLLPWRRKHRGRCQALLLVTLELHQGG